MASLIFAKNPLAPLDREVFTLGDGERPIDWLLKHYPPPLGCGGEVHFSVNGQERPLDDLGYEPAPDDVVLLAVNPGLEAFLISLAVALIVAGLSIAIELLFFKKPQAPAFTAAANAEPSPVYSVRSGQNVARLAEPVPVVYGNVLHTPDICAQPYKFNLNSQDEAFDVLLCLGHGDFTVQQVLVGDTDANDMEGVQYHVATPAEHNFQIGNLAGVFTPPFYENMLSSVEVGQQQFINMGDSAGWFRLGKSGQTGRTIFVDITYPQGLYQLLDDAINYTGTQVSFGLLVQEADPNGNPLAGTLMSFSQNEATLNAKNPLRRTYSFDCGRSANWLVQMQRQTEQFPNGNEVNNYVWTGLRLLIDTPLAPGVQAYGDTTLLCVRILATAVSSSANNQVRVRLQRNLPSLGAGPNVPTTSPADAFTDIITNAVYGARRPLAEVDTGRLRALQNFWALGGYDYGFNAIYTGRTTVFEALTNTMQVVAAAPLPLGALMSVAQDGIKSVRTMMFSDQNIARDSFKLSYTFNRDGDNDGVEIEYRDPLTFAPAFARWPVDSQDPEKLTLFGCTDARQAGEFARLSWQRKTGNRRAVTFDTEMEGLIPILGERAAVSHTLPRWGQSGFVLAVAGLTVTLDRKLAWDEPLFVPPYAITFRDEFGGISSVVQCTRGPTDDVAILASDPWAGSEGTWSLVGTQERTHFAFGDATRAVKDFIWTTLAPKDDHHVTVSGVYYDPTVFVGSFAFLAYPVP